MPELFKVAPPQIKHVVDILREAFVTTSGAGSAAAGEKVLTVPFSHLLLSKPAVKQNTGGAAPKKNKETAARTAKVFGSEGFLKTVTKKGFNVEVRGEGSATALNEFFGAGAAATTYSTFSAPTVWLLRIAFMEPWCKVETEASLREARELYPQLPDEVFPQRLWNTLFASCTTLAMNSRVGSKGLATKNAGALEQYFLSHKSAFVWNHLQRKIGINIMGLVKLAAAALVCEEAPQTRRALALSATGVNARPFCERTCQSRVHLLMHDRCPSLFHRCTRSEPFRRGIGSQPALR